MKKKLFWKLIIILIVLPLMSCQKEQTLLDSDLSSLGEFVDGVDVLGDDSELKNYLNILYEVSNATSYSQIPVYAFRCHSGYKPVYRHLRQPDNSSCSWTSYVICAGNIAAFNGKTYPVSLGQVSLVKNGCSGSKLITSLASYANTVNGSLFSARVFALPKSSSYLTVVKQMMILLETHKSPFVTISLSGSVGHYVTVYSIHWDGTLLGSKVYFMDSLDPDKGSFDANIKSLSLLDFLYRMKTNSNSYYNFLRILPV